MDFKEFVRIVRYGIISREIKVSKPLTDYDLAVMYAVGQIGERKGYPCDTTAEEIYNEMAKFAPELLEEGEKQ